MERAYILIEQRRFDRAIPEIKLHLAEEPEDASALSLLAMCYNNIEDYTKALKYSQEAVGLQPENDFCFYAMARAQIGLSNYKQAQKAIDIAIELEPEDPDYYGLKAAIYTNKNEWQKAIACCQEGLALDPKHIECNNLKALALRKADLIDDEEETLREALRKNPEDEFTHANLGWSYLEKGERDRSLTHFHEALRIDPEFEWAREGAMTAMKSKNIVYRTILKYFFWMSKKKESHQQGLMFGLFIGYILVLNLSYKYPALDYVVYAYMAFALSTWFSEPFFTAIMFLSRDGRMILRDREKLESKIFLPLAAASLVFLVFYIVGESFLVFNSMFLCLGLLMGISAISTCRSREGIHNGILFMVLFGLFSLVSIILLFVQDVWSSYFFHAALYLLLAFEIFLQSES